jgi:hypothetical protein
MNGNRPPQKYSEILSARLYLKSMLEDAEDQEMKIIIIDLIGDLDKFFINQVSTFEFQIDINYPII